MTATRPEAKPCRVRLKGGTIKFVAAHHRETQKAVLAAQRAGSATVTVAGTTLTVASISIVLPARKRRGEPTAPPYLDPKEKQP